MDTLYTLSMKEAVKSLSQFKKAYGFVSDAHLLSIQIRESSEILIPIWDDFQIELFHNGKNNADDPDNFLLIAGDVDILARNEKSVKFLSKHLHFAPDYIDNETSMPLHTMATIFAGLLDANEGKNLFNESGMFEIKIQCDTGDLNSFLRKNRRNKPRFQNFMTSVNESLQYFSYCERALSETVSHMYNISHNLSDLKFSSLENDYVIKKYKLYEDNSDRGFFQDNFNWPDIQQDEMLVYSSDFKMAENMREDFNELVNLSRTIDGIRDNEAVGKCINSLDVIITAAQNNKIKKEKEQER